MLATETFEHELTAQAIHPTAHSEARQAKDKGGLLAVLQKMPGSTARIVQPREHVFFEGDTKSHVYLVETGALSIYKILADGRRQVIDFALPGDIVGLGSAVEHYCSAQATVATKLRALPADALHRVARQDPKVGMHLYDMLSAELAAARDLVVTVGQRSATQRVAAFLLALSKRNERYSLDPARIALPMTRSDIADFLGLTIETVSRTITKLKVRKLIELCPAGRINLLNTAALNDICTQG